MTATGRDGHPSALLGTSALDGRWVRSHFKVDPQRHNPKTWHVPTPSDDVLPFPLLDGWPIALPGCDLTIRETGVGLGSLMLEDEEWRAMRSTPVFSLRIDDHPILDSWTTRHPDGSESSGEFEIPLNPVAVPTQALADSRAFTDWVMDTHGGRGRLLLWDGTHHWWMAQESDLELVVTCAPHGMFASDSEAPSWLAFADAAGRQELDELCARYGVTWAK